ncbi:hypothetical protein ID0203_01150 [Helicobacter pylori]|nr:hypothetical protein KVD45_07150 [Helicobacter pylori]
MKIKAIMMALLFSGALLLGDDVNSMQEQIDQSIIDPLDPNLIKEMMKAIVRINNNVKMNNENMHQCNVDIYTLTAKVIELENSLKKLQKRMSQAKPS